MACWSGGGLGMKPIRRLGGGGAKASGFAADVRTQIGSAFEQFHGEEPLVVFAEELKEGKQVGMGEFSERAEFDFETVNAGGIDGAKGFESDAGVAFAVVSFVNGAHATGAETSKDGESFVS